MHPEVEDVVRCWVVLLLLSLGSVASPECPSWVPREGRELIGTKAPEWSGLRWLQGGPLRLADLRGRPVLIRFWLTECPYCAATAPALQSLHEKYAGKGLVVIGIHHPKSEETKDSARVLSAAKALHMTFPIATDDEWETVHAYGVGSVFQRFTSVSVLIDRKGVIRFVHDGGEFHAGGGPEHSECNAAFEALDCVISEVLKTR